ncbi:ketopantoate reductase family protein [Methanolobus sp.]|uniref:ketopantoate reductase family protein n=1 Tax=Methanolobus sp. TaxID=1874737 RepID=UPI0025E35411|nr:ketopantoate reductase family protein [Methanolobus sp.]
MDEIMKICFFGVGGVGGYIGTIVTEKYKDKHEIYYIARGQHKDTICKNGLTLKKAGENKIITASPKKCTDTVNDLPVCDIVILSVKIYDLENAIKEISKITNERTIILPLLNGVDIYDRIREHLKTGIVLPSCVYVGTHIENPGIIYQNGGSCKISIGADPESPDFDLEPLFTIFKDARIDFELEENVNISIWSKYMFIAAYGLVTAAFDSTLGEVLGNSEQSQIIKSIMNEIETISRKLHVALDDDIVEKSYLKAMLFPYDTKTSFQRDVESKGRTNEGDLFGGTVIRYGNALGVQTPTTKIIYERLLNKFQ